MIKLIISSNVRNKSAKEELAESVDLLERKIISVPEEFFTQKVKAKNVKK
ncbi:hypothetical protein ACSAZL_15115 [Methanosarcina sp. T3]